jgi:signal transduction histidine kinase
MMVALVLPPLWLLVFRPLSRLLAARKEAEEEIRKQARDVEAIASENAALLQAEQQERTRADALRSASLAISRTLDIEEVFKSLLEHLGKIVPYDTAKLMLREGESSLRVRAVFNHAGTPESFDRPFGSFDSGANAAVREVLTSRRSVVIDDTRKRPMWGGGAQGDLGRSWLGVPLLAGAKVLGLYTLVQREPNFFTPERIRLIEALSAPASVAVANAQLFDELRAGREQLQRLSRNLVEGQEKERLRVARELHDEAGQLLASLTGGLRLLERAAGSPEEVVARARDLQRIAEEAQEGLHRLASDLRPAALDHLGLIPALGQLAARVQSSGGPEVRMETVGFDGRRLSPEVEIALFRIAQEALTNAARHSGAGRMNLILWRDGSRLRLVMEDDGHGFDVDAAGRSDRLGLPGIRERAEMLGGTLVIEARPGSGTTLVVEAPDVS